MAQPRQAEKGDVQQKVNPPTEQVLGEMALIKSFGEMVKKVDEIYLAALKMESSPQLAKLLGEVGIVKVTLQESITMLKEAEEMRIAAEALGMSRDAERESDE